MKIMLINAVPYGSTGKIMFSVSRLVQENIGSTIAATGFSWHQPKREEHLLIGGIFTKTWHICMSRLFGNHGLYSTFSTKALIKTIKRFSPDVIHLHNIHGWYLNIKHLFEYLKKCDIPVVWTLHDCWAFTGGCAHYTYCGCDRWMMGCGKCKNLKAYPISSKVDKTQKMWKLKKELFSNMPNLTLVTPSVWLSEEVKNSFLNKYPIKVINNGIDLDTFKPTAALDLEQYGIKKENHIVLGVSLGWNDRKGLDVFEALAKRLPEDYTVVLVGTDEKTVKKLSSNIVSINRTQNTKELAALYSAAEVFVNPTREDTFPTVNIEALACGTPVITFNVGGSPEIIDETCGAVVDCNDIDALEKEIVRVCTTKPYSPDACVKKAQKYNEKERFEEYLKLYKALGAKGLSLEELKEIEFNLLKVFRAFCEENNIKYFLSNGTLLGAVKYGGFIPWDDDIDVLVPREDYNKLISLFRDDERYKLFAFERNNSFSFPFAKLCDMSTVKEEYNTDNGVMLGVDIDIFPLDAWGDNLEKAKKAAKKIRKKMRSLELTKLIYSNSANPIKRVVKGTLMPVYRGIRSKPFIASIIKKSTKEDPKTSAYLGCKAWCIYGDREIIPAKAFEKAIDVEFNGELFKAPVGYDMYLRSLYGDYEKDPPKEKQKSHHRFTAYRK